MINKTLEKQYIDNATREIQNNNLSPEAEAAFINGVQFGLDQRDWEVTQ